MMICAEKIVSLILVPVLIVVLGFILFVLIAKRNKTDTLARLTYELQNLLKACSAVQPDDKAVRKLDTAAAKCELLAGRASFEQKQDIGTAGDNVAAARRILHALTAAKVSGAEAARYIDKAAAQLRCAYDFLINTLGITAAPPSASLAFFNKNARSENARRYLDSIDAGSHEKEE